jgi:hypothetical protein
MAFELSRIGAAIKIVEPGGMKTDFMGRSMVLAPHPAYEAWVTKLLSVLNDPAQSAQHATPEQVAEVVYQAATDGKDQLRYIAGEDARGLDTQRRAMGVKAFRKVMDQMLLG